MTAASAPAQAGRPLLLEALLGLPQSPGVAAVAGRQALGELVTSGIAVDLTGSGSPGARSVSSPTRNVTKSTMTHHLRVRREAGVIRQRREGTTKLTSLRREDLDAGFPGLLDAVLETAAGAP